MYLLWLYYMRITICLNSVRGSMDSHQMPSHGRFLVKSFATYRTLNFLLQQMHHSYMAVQLITRLWLMTERAQESPSLKQTKNSKANIRNLKKIWTS